MFDLIPRGCFLLPILLVTLSTNASASPLSGLSYFFGFEAAGYPRVEFAPITWDFDSGHVSRSLDHDGFPDCQWFELDVKASSVHSTSEGRTLTMLDAVFRQGMEVDLRDAGWCIVFYRELDPDPWFLAPRIEPLT